MLLGACARYQPIDVFAPGPAGLQEARALHYDPYPSTEAGPEVVGGRPREYQAPPHQPAWVQQRAPFEHRPSGTSFPIRLQPPVQ